MNRDQYELQLRAIGHFRGAVIHQENGRFRAECECGYVSTTRVNAREAIDTIEHHRRKALAETRRNGPKMTPLRASTP